MKRFGGVPRLLAAVAIAALLASGLPAPVLAAGGPTVTAPAVAFAQMGQASNKGIPLTVSWPLGTPDGAPIARYELQKSIDAGAWANITLPNPLTRSLMVKIRPWTVIQLRLRAIDTANTAGDWAQTNPQWLSVAQETDPGVSLSSGWQVVNDSRAFGSRRAVTSTAGESATFSFVGRQVAWVAPVGPNRGTATVASSLGTATVHQARNNASSRRIVFRASWPDNSTHDFSITATSSGKPTDVDALISLGDPPDGQMVGAGDISTCSNDHDAETAALVTSVLNANANATAFTLGDNVYPNGSAANFASCYEPSWGVFKARTRPTPGNHDYLDNPGAGPYFAYFGAGAGTPGRGWYRYQSGTWRVYSLNSECALSSPCFEQQLSWLKADLANQPHRCVLAMWHGPRFSTGPHGGSTRMAQAFSVLYDAGADVVIAGHDHGYQRFAPQNPSGAADSARGLRGVRGRDRRR